MLGEVIITWVETGEMLVNQWVDQNRYYVKEDGKWIPEAQKGKDGWKQNASGDWYHFQMVFLPETNGLEVIIF